MPKKPAQVVQMLTPSEQRSDIQTLREFETGGLQIVSYSELDTFRQCPLKHQLSYKERWKKPVVEGSPLYRGSLWHKVMEEHYSLIKAWQDRNDNRPMTPTEEADFLNWIYVHNIIPILADTQTGAQSDDQKLIQWMYDGYIEQYGVDNDWVILAIEYPFELVLPTPDNKPSQYGMKGKMDLVIMKRSDGSVWIIDHKSGADLPTAMSLEIDDQFGGYTWAGQTLGWNVRGSIHSASRTKQNKGDLPGAVLNGNVKKQTLEQRFSRTPLTRDKQEARNIANDAWAAAMNAYPPQGKELPLYSSPDARQCGWKCDFKEVHLIARTGRDIHEVLQEFGFVQDFTRH
jgi:hypothetical protein